jgi:hypothetical protein
MNAFAKEPETESQLQAEVIRWLRVQEMLGRLTFFAIANGEKRRPRTGKKLQTQGVRAGVYDLCIVGPSFVGFLELKTEKGKVSADQKAWGQRFDDFGIPHAICRSIEDVQKVVTGWLQTRLSNAA